MQITKIVKRRHAKAAGLKRYFTGKSCKYGHIAERYTSNTKCVECSRKDYEDNKEKKQKYAKEYGHKYRQENRKKLNKKKREKYHNNVNKAREKKRKQYHANIDKNRKRNSEKYWSDVEKSREYHRKYRYRRHRTPLGQLRAVCDGTAKRLMLGKISKSKLTLLKYNPSDFIAHLESTLPPGVSFEEARADGWHVDHIVPLSFLSNAIEDKTTAFLVAMGLENLRMVPSTENLSKHATLNLLNPEQVVVFEKLMQKHNLFDEFISVAIPY